MGLLLAYFKQDNNNNKGIKMNKTINSKNTKIAQYTIL